MARIVLWDQERRRPGDTVIVNPTSVESIKERYHKGPNDKAGVSSILGSVIYLNDQDGRRKILCADTLSSVRAALKTQETEEPPTFSTTGRD